MRAATTWKKSGSPLPDEVVTEILSWLPVKSLLRFRCVCKTWLRLLKSDPYFINLHLHRLIKAKNKNPSTMILCQRYLYKPPPYTTAFYIAKDYASYDKVIEFKLSSHKSPETVFGICNGLVCLGNFSHEKYSNVYIWNPLTQDHITIPCSCIPSHFPTHVTAHFTFGFSFHQGTNEYKVIRIATAPNLLYRAFEIQSHVSVYTLGTNSWRTLEPISYVEFPQNSTLVNGALHWLAARPGSISSNVIVSFNIKDEIFQEIRQPLNGIVYDYPYHMEIGELGGLLCMFCSVPEENVQIWVMKEYGVVDSWNKQFTIGQPLHRFLHFLAPLGLGNSGEILIIITPWQLILYNPRSNASRIIRNFRVEISNAYMYMGSLVSPTLINELRHIIDIERKAEEK